MNTWHDPYGADNYGEMRRRLLQGVSDDDMASKEEYYDFGYLNIIPDWAKDSEYAYWFLARQIGRARIDSDKSDIERYIRSRDLTLYAEDVHNFLKIAKGMSDGQISEQFVKYFSGLEKRVNWDYFERIGSAKVVRRGTSTDELDSIIDGSWRQRTMAKPSRRWIDITVNKKVANEYAQSKVRESGKGIVLEIDKESIKDQIVSPGYRAKTLFYQPQDDIAEPDSLMRGMFNEEHHLLPDVDLRQVEMNIIVEGSPQIKEELGKEYQGINSNWEI